SGFELPFSENVLVPALPLLAGRELGEGPLQLGKAPEHVVLASPPWTLFLEAGEADRLPHYKQGVPPQGENATWLELGGQDAKLLARALPGLPGKEDDHSPVTLDLGQQVLVRAREGSQVAEVALPHSRATGPPVRLATDRTYLLRALQLGFS